MAALLRSARNLKLLRYLTVPGGQVVQVTVRNTSRALLPAAKCTTPAILSSHRFLNSHAAGKQFDYDYTHLQVPQDPVQRQAFNRSLQELDENVRRMGRITKTQVTRMFDEMCQSGCAVSEHALLLIRCCGSLMAELSAPERTELAHMIWDKLPELGIKRNTNHYNAMLKVYLQNNHQISLSEFLENMESSGVEPNRVTYQRIIGLYCQEGDIQGAGKVLEFMKKKDMPITDGVFNSLITGHARAGDMANAEGMLTIMRNVSLEPTVDTYTSLMCAYAEKGDIENIREVLKQLRSEDTKLSNKNLMLVLHSLVTSGHEEHVSEILSHMQFGTRYAPDAINLCLTLLTEGRDDVAMEILKTFPKIRPEVETMLAAGEEFQQGSFYIKHLVLLNRPLEDIVKQMDEMKALKLHSAPYAVALQVSLEQGNVENSYALMDIMKEHGEPIRQHYFWPLMASSHRQNDVQGMCDIVKKIVESDVRLDSGSCTMYVFPTLGGDAQHLLAELQKMGVHVDETLVASLIRWEIGNGRAENITKLVKQFGPDLVYLSLFRSDLIQAIYRDPLIMKTFTKMIKSNGVESIQGDFGSFMYHLTKNIPEGYRNTILPYLQEFLKELKNQDCYITANDFRGLRRNFDRQRLNYLTPMALDLIHPDVMNSEDTQQSDLLPIQMLDTEKLDKTLVEMKEKNMNTRGVLRKLIMAHTEKQNYEMAIGYKRELDSAGYKPTAAIYAMLMNLAANLGKVDEALEFKRDLEIHSPADFQLSDSKYIRLIKALAVAGRMQESLDLIGEMANQKIKYSVFLEKNIFHVLNDVAMSGGGAEAVKQLVEKFLETGIVNPTARMFSPLVTSYLLNDNVSGALDCVIETHNKYQIVARLHDVLVKLVEVGDKEQLQKAMMFCMQSVGDANALYDLVFAFLSAGKYDQARRVIEKPGFRYRAQRVEWYATKCIKTGFEKQLEELVEITKDLFECDRDNMYFHLLKLYGNKNDWQKCLDVWTRLQEEQVTVRPRTMKYLADILRKNGQEVTFETPKITMEHSGDTTNTSTEKYETLITGLIKAHNFPEAKRLFDEARSKEHVFDDNMYLNIFKSATRLNYMKDAVALKELCIEKGIELDDYAMSDLIVCYIKNNDVQEAEQVFNDLVEKGRPPLRFACIALARQFESEGKPDKIKDIYEKYNQVGQEKIPFMRFLLGAYITCQNPDAAIETVREELIEKKIPPGAVGTKALFKKLIVNNFELDKVYKLVDDLWQQGTERQAGDLLDALVSSGKMEEATNLLKKYPELEEYDGCFTRFATSELFTNRTSERFLNFASLLHNARAKEILYFYLFKFYEREKDWRGALELKEKAETEGVPITELTLKRISILLRKNNQTVPFEEPVNSLQFYRTKLMEQKKGYEIAEINDEPEI